MLRFMRIREKIGPKIVDEIFMRYKSDSNSNRFLIINSEIRYISKNIIVEVRMPIILKTSFHIKSDLIQV